MTVIDLGKLRFNFAGAYNPGTTYEYNDCVLYGGNVYCYTNNTASTTGTPSQDTAHWVFMMPGFNFAGAWVTNTLYRLNDIISIDANAYICTAEHTSGVFATDVQTKWTKLAGGIYWKGNWTTGTAYMPGDLVTSGTSAYVAVNFFTSSAALTTDVTNGNFQLVGINGGVPSVTGNGGMNLHTDGVNILWAFPTIAQIVASGQDRVMAADFVFPKRSGMRYHVGDSAGAALGTVAAVAGTAYAIPFTVSRPMSITQLSAECTNFSNAGNVVLGIMDSQEVSGNTVPHNVLAQATVNITATGVFNGTISGGPTALNPGNIYWAIFISTQANTFRSLTAASQFPAFGRTSNSTTVQAALQDANAAGRFPNYSTAGLVAQTTDWPTISTTSTPDVILVSA